MKRFLLTLSAVAALNAVALTSASAEDYTMITVGEHKIAYSKVEAVWQEMFPKGAAPEFSEVDGEVKRNMVRGMVGEYLLYNNAMDSGIDQTKEVKEKLERLKKKIVVQSFLDQKAASKVTPADVKKEYDRLKEEAANEKEVKASHILVAEKAIAEKLLKKLKNGAAFEDLAKENSSDKASAISGGDLGYFTKEKMVPAFADAAFSLKVGEVSEPVQSDFGWHIIKVEDSRAKTMAPFVEQRAVIQQKLKADALASYIDDLVDSASVTYYNAKGEKVEFSKTPDSTKE